MQLANINIIMEIEKILSGLNISYDIEKIERISTALAHRSVIECIQGDYDAITRRDPSQSGIGRRFPISSPQFSVFFHRLTHVLYMEKSEEAHDAAGTLHQHARVTTGVDIHPGATIGARFVVDHGSGTVIGETAEIGDDCYVLNGVILGARGIAGNRAGKRHPTLGNRVEIGSFARIFGPVTIGDDVIVTSLSCITRDIPDRVCVRPAGDCAGLVLHPRRLAISLEAAE